MKPGKPRRKIVVRDESYNAQVLAPDPITGKYKVVPF